MKKINKIMFLSLKLKKDNLQLLGMKRVFKHQALQMFSLKLVQI